ncbi:MAG: hypothetical protein EA366_15740, partial [Spirulina sp. DLM2.Bin59]
WQWGAAQPHPLVWPDGQGEPGSYGKIAVQFTGHSDERGDRLQIKVGAAACQNTPHPQSLRVQQFHTYLHRAIPCYSHQQRQWLPQVCGPGGKPIPLHWLQRGLQLLLGQLLRQPGPVRAAGLGPKALARPYKTLPG